jgi:hypothetical protein
VESASRLARAFRDPLNWIGGIIVAGGAYLATLSPVAAVAAWAVYEAVYLLVVARTAWFARRVGAAGRSAAEASLTVEDQARYAELTRRQAEIAAGLPDGSPWSTEIVGRLDGLREQFLRFARKRQEYRALLRGLADAAGAAPLDPFGRPLPPRGRERALAAADIETVMTWVREGYDRRQAEAERERARESDPEGQALAERRQEVTGQLRATVDEIGRAARNVERQLDLVCDSFRLIHAQLGSRPPEQLVPEVEAVTRSSQALADALAELAPLEEQIQRLSHR